MKQVDKLFVGMAVEDQRAAISVQRHFQHAVRRTGKAGVGETVAISVKATHGILRATGEATRPGLRPIVVMGMRLRVAAAAD